MRWASRDSVLVVLMAAAVAGCAPRRPLPPRAGARIVCLGDSITDGCTYPQLIVQALAEARRPVPTVICAGVASDTAAQMAARLDESVLLFRPAVVTFSAGANDALRGIPPGRYEQALREVVARVEARGGSMLLFTPCIIEPGKAGDAAAQRAARKKAQAAEELIAQYIRVIRKVASEEGCPVAEANALMQAARRDGKAVMADDGIHPNYLGQGLMARAALDAMGCRDVPLPREFRPALFPGVIAEWQMRLAPLDAQGRPQRLTAESVRQLRPDGSWHAYRLPDPAPADRPTAEDWWEQERRNGFGLRVHQRVGKGLVQAVAFLDAPQAGRAYINTGVGISTVWLNGRKMHEQGSAWTGFHAGKERIPVELARGRNVLAAEVDGPHFFLSVTAKLAWEEGLRFE